MNSGKSTALIQVAHNYEERGQRVLVVKPATDTKSPAVLSRISVALPTLTPATSVMALSGPGDICPSTMPRSRKRGLVMIL